MGLTLPEYASLDCTGLVHAVSQGHAEPAQIRSLAIDALELITDWRAVAEIYGRDEVNPRRGLLSGVPILHKDGGAQLAGLPREYGSRLGSGQACTHTSHFFATLLSHGCEVVGRSQVPELHMSVLADNATTGSTRNPWNTSRSMGGSTAGITALALGAVPAVHGGDSGGSLRVPASWAGCYTLKPTRSTVSASPGGTELFGLNEIFLATRSLRDIRLFRGVLSSVADDDFAAPSPAPRHWADGRRRVGICESFYPGHPVDPGIVATLRDFADAAARLGFEVEDTPVCLDFEAACEALYVIASLDLQIMVSSLTTEGGRAVKEACQPYISRWYEEGAGIAGEAVVRAIEAIGAIGRQLTYRMNKVDFMVTPVTAAPPPPLDTVHEIGVTAGSRELNRAFEEIVHFCAGPNMSGHPALVIPYARPGDGPVAGSSQPCGVQIIGQPGGDVALIEFAELFDRGFARPPAHLSLA